MYLGLEQLYKNLRKDLSDEAKEDFTNAIGKLLHFIELLGKNVNDKSKKYLKMNNSYVSYKKLINNPIAMFSIRSCIDVASHQFGDSFTLFVRGEDGKLNTVKCDPAKALKIAVDEIDKFCSKQVTSSKESESEILFNVGFDIPLSYNQHSKLVEEVKRLGGKVLLNGSSMTKGKDDEYSLVAKLNKSSSKKFAKFCDDNKMYYRCYDSKTDKEVTKQFKTTAGTKMSYFIDKRTGKIITASSKEEVLALDMDRVKDSTKLLYDKMNQGDLQYYCRQDDKFEDYVNSTLEDEIHDTIKSDKNLINDCVARRKSNESIVWNTLYRVFQYVNKRWKINTNVSSDKMKNWFVTNGTDYKKALAKIISNLTDFRNELRETETAVTADYSSDDVSKLLGTLDDLKDEIKKFDNAYGVISKFLERHKYSPTKIKTVASKEVIGIIWSLKNKSGMEGSFALELSKGLTGSTHCVIDHPNQNVKTLALNRFLQEIYDFMK